MTQGVKLQIVPSIRSTGRLRHSWAFSRLSLGGLEPRRGGGEKSAWYPLFAHALNYNIKPRGFMQMTSQNFPSVNNDVHTTQRIHKDLIALTLGTWSSSMP